MIWQKVYPFFKKRNLRLYFLKFQQLFIIFWFASFFGHYLEVFWSRTFHMALGYSVWRPEAPTIMPLAPPYGLGAVAVVLLVWPFVKKYNLNPFGVLMLNSFITGLVEYLCALFLVMFEGQNIYWDYTDRFLNLNGFVCLQSSLLFGIVSTVFLLLAYPYCEDVFQKANKKRLGFLFWALFASYMLDLVLLVF